MVREKLKKSNIIHVKKIAILIILYTLCSITLSELICQTPPLSVVWISRRSTGVILSDNREFSALVLLVIHYFRDR